jgi:hypothetical protein
VAAQNLIVNFDECKLYMSKNNNNQEQKQKKKKKKNQQNLHCSHIEVVFYTVLLINEWHKLSTLLCLNDFIIET